MLPSEGASQAVTLDEEPPAFGGPLDAFSPDRLRSLNKNWRGFIRAADALATEPDATLGFAGSFTLDPMLPYIGALLLEAGSKHPEILNANYNQVARVCLDPASEFGTTDLDAIVLFWRIEDLADPSDIGRMRTACVMMLDAIERLRSTYTGTIIVGLPPRPRPFTDGIAEFARATPLVDLWHEHVVALNALLRKLVGVYAIDLEAIIAGLGHPAALDHRKELLYRQPYSDAFHAACASAVVRLFKARASEPKKCLVLDCDNTLWGGVIGEDGVVGIELGEDFPGRAFLEFQRQVVALRNTGIFIALNSKNNPDDVWEMFDNHSGMVLKRTDISVARVNWKTKSENLKEIAKDLNIGLDALVFIDDSHFEIAEVRRNAPEVMAIQVPEDVADFPVLMKNVARLFDRLDITADDTARVEMMNQEMDRRQLAQSMTDADFLSSLGLEVFLYPPGATDLARVTQLINKTNQFNVTTRRYALDDIAGLVADAETDVYCATVRDKFGDYGLIGVGIVCHRDEGISEFDSLLMSCRVLGRGVETAMIAYAADLAAKRGAKELRGLYKRTRKNSMVADLFSRHGFTSPSGDMPDLPEVSWSRSTDPLAVPNYLAVRQQRPA